jgi:hypothetical protein
MFGGRRTYLVTERLSQRRPEALPPLSSGAMCSI